MGKANRLKTEKAENTLTSSTTKRNNKKGLPTWLGTVIVITVLAALILTAAFFALDSAGTFNRLRVVMATENYEVTVPMMSYAIYSEYQNLVATYENYSQQLGFTVSMPTGKGGDQLDKTKALRDQIYARQDESGLTLETPETWFDHFAKEAATKLTEKLAMCEAATAKGIKLEDGEEESIQMTLDTIALYAAYYECTTNGYIAIMYGEGVSEGDVRDMLEIDSLYYKYQKQRAEEFTAGIMPDQVQAEYDANVSKYDVFADYIGYTFKASFTASTNKDAETAKLENEAKAAKYEAKKAKYRALVDELETAAEANPASYPDKLLEVLKELFFEEEKEALEATKAVGVELTQEEIDACRETANKNAANAALNAIVKNADSSASTMDTTFKTWLTDKNTPRKAGDVYTKIDNYNAFNEEVTSKESEGNPEEAPADEKTKDYANSSSSYTIYLLTSGLKRNDGVLRSASHILFNEEAYKDSKTGEALTSSESFSGQKKVLADRVLAKHGKLTAEYMAAELLALMLEEEKLVEKTVDGKTYYEMDPAVFEAYGKQYSDDSSIVLDNVKQGQEEKDFENWLFDKNRALNEVTSAAVSTADGYDIILHRGDEKDAWSYSIRVSLAEGQYDAWLKQLLKDIPLVEHNTDNLNYIV